MSEKLVITENNLDLGYLKSLKNKRAIKVFYTCKDCGKEYSKSVAAVIDVHDFRCHGCHIKHVYEIKTPEEKAKIQKAKEEGCLKKYGCTNCFGNKEIQEKIKSTNIEKYGTANINSLPEVRKKIKKTCLEKYGVENFSQLPSEHDRLVKVGKEKCYKKIQQFCKNNNIENVSQLPNHKEIMQKYFATHSVHNSGGKYAYKNITFDSSWEVAFYIYLEDYHYNFKYQPCSFEYKIKNGKLRKYYVDFQVNNQLIEIKGGQFFNEKGEPQYVRTGEYWWEKYNTMLEHNVIILQYKDIKHCISYVNNTYGGNYIKSFLRHPPKEATQLGLPNQSS